MCTVERVRLRPTRRRNLAIVEAAIRDESGPGVAIWFNQRYLAKNLKPGMRLSLRGERRPTIGAEIVVKSHERAADDGEALHTSGLVPVYPASERVSSRRLVELVADALAARRRRGRPAARRREGPPRACLYAATRCTRATSRATSQRRVPPAGAWPTTSSTSSSSACSAAGHASRRRRARGRSRAPATWPRRSSKRCRSS